MYIYIYVGQSLQLQHFNELTVRNSGSAVSWDARIQASWNDCCLLRQQQACSGTRAHTPVTRIRVKIRQHYPTEFSQEVATGGADPDTGRNISPCLRHCQSSERIAHYFWVCYRGWSQDIFGHLFFIHYRIFITHPQYFAYSASKLRRFSKSDSTWSSKLCEETRYYYLKTVLNTRMLSFPDACKASRYF
jgi:hypothetical protein